MPGSTSMRPASTAPRLSPPPVFVCVRVESWGPPRGEGGGISVCGRRRRFYLPGQGEDTDKQSHAYSSRPSAQLAARGHARRPAAMSGETRGRAPARHELPVSATEEV